MVETLIGCSLWLVSDLPETGSKTAGKEDISFVVLDVKGELYG